jgi:hypothetical protein
MKRAIIASILGIAASVTTTHGQGEVIFSTYFSSSQLLLVEYAGIGGGLNPPHVVGSGFKAELYYGLGSGLSFSELTPVAPSITSVGMFYPGSIVGNIVNFNNYSSGPVTFSIVAFDGTDYASSTSKTLRPVTWTEPALATQPYPAGMFTYSLLQAALPSDANGIPYISVDTIPEPGTSALAGLGAAALLMFRRRMVTTVTD